MACLVKKILKGHTYYYLVESGRVNGKPRIIKQQYLGTLDDIASAISAKNNNLPVPEFSVVLAFGAVSALFDIAERLGFRGIIDATAGKRAQGMPVGDSILLAAINRAVLPESKKGFWGWFDKTVLPNCFPLANKKNLSSQGFWNNMSLLNETKIQKIEDEIASAVVRTYNISTECLLFDNTNFFTYIDTNTSSTLANRGKSKERRSDLRIIGLSMMVSPDHSIPLFHETYPGNMNDAKRFGEVVGRLKKRYQKIGAGDCRLTLVFDKGNNSEDNMDTVCGRDGFDVIGGLRYNQCPEFNGINKEEFVQLTGERLAGTSAYRTTKKIYNRDMTVIVTFNKELYDAQLDGVSANIAKCETKLKAIEERLDARREKKVKRGKAPTVESVTKQVSEILSSEHMKLLFEYEVVKDADSRTIVLRYRFSSESFGKLKSERLGRSILFTNHYGWTTEQIVLAYRSQYHVEEAFKRMKDTQHLSFRPVRHFTDANIRVHAFYCVMALLLSSLLNREIEEMGQKVSVNRMLDDFQSIEQVITYFPANKKGKRCINSFSRMEGYVKEYTQQHNLTKYAMKAK